MAHMLTIISDLAAQRRSLLTTFLHKVSLLATIATCRRRIPENTLMNLATSAILLYPKYRIIGIEPHRCKLRLNRSLPRLLRLQLYLSLPPPRSLLKLSEGTITLGGNKLSDIRLEHAQVLGHLILLRSSKLRATKSLVSKHLGDLHHRLNPLPQIQILLIQPLPLHQGNIPCVKHLQELVPCNISLLRSVRASHQSTNPLPQTVEGFGRT